MNLEKLKKLLKEKTSEIEYTQGNYNNKGNLITSSIPTLTTHFCEIGVFNNETYFVIIINSNQFTKKFFNEIKNHKNIQIYGFIDFKKNLYPCENFNINNFFKEIKKDKYLQIEFDFQNIKTQDLCKEYFKIKNIFNKYNINVINQLKKDLRCK